MSEVEVLTQQITSLEIVYEQTRTNGLWWVMGVLISLIPGIVLVSLVWDDKKSYLKYVGIAFMLSSGVSVVGMFDNQPQPIYVELTELKDQREFEVRKEIKQLGCEELRLDILGIMEDEFTPDHYKNNLEFEQEYYYHKCEIPLLEEVKRLRDG